MTRKSKHANRIKLQLNGQQTVNQNGQNGQNGQPRIDTEPPVDMDLDETLNAGPAMRNESDRDEEFMRHHTPERLYDDENIDQISRQMMDSLTRINSMRQEAINRRQSFRQDPPSHHESGSNGAASSAASQQKVESTPVDESFIAYADAMDFVDGQTVYKTVRFERFTSSKQLQARLTILQVFDGTIKRVGEGSTPCQALDHLLRSYRPTTRRAVYEEMFTKWQEPIILARMLNCDPTIARQRIAQWADLIVSMEDLRPTESDMPPSIIAYASSLDFDEGASFYHTMHFVEVTSDKVFHILRNGINHLVETLFYVKHADDPVLAMHELLDDFPPTTHDEERKRLRQIGPCEYLYIDHSLTRGFVAKLNLVTGTQTVKRFNTEEEHDRYVDNIVRRRERCELTMGQTREDAIYVMELIKFYTKF